ncbi:MAG: hypothetical protein LBV00_00990 [Propionibacteriaceae bacterium]|jgi:hypothetical protein|nr:hypothetical protein [Propionibacteriaceae bacterium]
MLDSDQTEAALKTLYGLTLDQPWGDVAADQAAPPIIVELRDNHDARLGDFPHTKLLGNTLDVNIGAANAAGSYGEDAGKVLGTDILTRICTSSTTPLAGVDTVAVGTAGQHVDYVRSEDIPACQV